MHGHDVRVLQNYLTLAGFPTSVDGQFGPTTERNVIQFERSRALRANGVLTYSQALSLRAAVATTQATTSAATGKAQINADGTATAPAGAPQVVQQVIAAANQIISTPYKYGGGHASFTDTGYDCSGAVSYALHGGGLLSSPEDSSTLESYGSPGPGKWITVYADAGLGRGGGCRLRHRQLRRPEHPLGKRPPLAAQRDREPARRRELRRASRGGSLSR
jgi:peptidoglycan hydrolase-like protein with peptidoglycan-binding domain